VVTLSFGAAFMDGGQAEVAGQAAGGGTGIHPGEFESDQGQREVLGSFDEPAVLGVEESGGDAGFVEHGQQRVLVAGPLMGIAGPVGHEAGHRAAGHRAGGLDQHGQIVAVGEAPLHGAQRVGWQGLQGGRAGGWGGFHGGMWVGGQATTRHTDGQRQLEMIP